MFTSPAAGRSSMSPPTAPPLSSLGGAAAVAGGSSAASSSAGVGAPDCDAELYADLVRRAGGDAQLVGLWLAEMGYKQAAPAGWLGLEKQPSSIKAVGGGLAAWASMPAVRGAGSPSKDYLKTTASAPLPRTDRDLDSQAAEAGAPRHFFCPISLQIMRDPVMLATGQTYDRPCIERWIAAGNSSCPATGQMLAAPVQLVPNVALRNSIEEWAEKHAPWLLDGNRKVKPVPKDEAFGAMPAPNQVTDPDLAFAIRLQQEELQRIANGRRDTAYGAYSSRASFGGGVAPPGTPSRSSSQRSAAASATSTGGWASLTTLLLVFVTACWVALFIVSLADNGWNLEDLGLNPWAGASQAALLAVGAQQAALVVGPEWWRLLSSAFVNAGVIQLLLNMSCLWTFGRYLEASRLPRPAFSITAIYLLGGWIGSLASANLDAYYVTCGASAGVCALMGAVAADQVVNARKYVHHVYTAIVLALMTALFVVASLLPLLDPWATAAGLLTGFLLGTALLLVPHSARRRTGARRATALQCLCLGLVVGAAAAGAVGVGLNAQIGTKAGFLKDGSCVDFGFWDCLPVGSSPNGCFVEATTNGTAAGTLTLYCPAGTSIALPSTTSVNSADTGAITALCYQYCGSSAGSSGSSGDSSSGGFPSPPSNSSSPSPSPSSEAGSAPVAVSSPPAAQSPPVSSDPDQLLI